jgi:hypothetical protein
LDVGEQKSDYPENSAMMNVWQKLRTAYDDFLFESCDPRMCSLLRISIGFILIIYTTVWMLDAERWFTDAGVLKSATAEQFSAGQFKSVLFLLPSTTPVVAVCLSALMLHSVLLLLGCWSRIQAFAIFIWLLSFHHRNPLICDGEDTVLRWILFAMIFMPLDHRFSLLRSLRNGPASTATTANAWALRIIHIELTAIYLSTAISKFQGETWRDGTALYYVSRMTDCFGRLWLPDMLFETPWVVRLSTWGVLAVEFALPVLLWIPPTRRFAVLMGIGLHLAIEYSMNLFLFEWIMIIGLTTFLGIKPRESRGNFAPAENQAAAF